MRAFRIALVCSKLGFGIVPAGVVGLLASYSAVPELPSLADERGAHSNGRSVGGTVRSFLTTFWNRCN
jgi:hypothetical protein